MEIFVYSDLSGFSDLQHVIINVFSSPTEEVRSAASYALGESHVTSKGSGYKFSLIHFFLLQACPDKIYIVRTCQAMSDHIHLLDNALNLLLLLCCYKLK